MQPGTTGVRSPCHCRVHYPRLDSSCATDPTVTAEASSTPQGPVGARGSSNSGDSYPSVGAWDDGAPGVQEGCTGGGGSSASYTRAARTLGGEEGGAAKVIRRGDQCARRLSVTNRLCWCFPTVRRATSTRRKVRWAFQNCWRYPRPSAASSPPFTTEIVSHGRCAQLSCVRVLCRRERIWAMLLGGDSSLALECSLRTGVVLRLA